jgi:hypothetical protein
VRGDSASRLPPGYTLDLVSDPCVLILRNAEGEIVARFTRKVDPEEIRLAAEEDYEQGG